MAQTIRILYIPPYYEYHFDLALDRFITDDEHIEYRIFTIDKKYCSTDLNLLLSLCRSIMSNEQIQMIISDCQVGQLIVAKLTQEYLQIYNRGMKFLNIFQCMNRYLIMEVFDADDCIPTLMMNITHDWKENKEKIELFLANYKNGGYVKSTYGFDEQLSSFRVRNWQNDEEIINTYVKLYEEQYNHHLLPLFRIYISKKQYPSIFQANYLIQPFYDLVTYPHWRLVIANACIYNKEIVMWPLVDGYSGWPFLAQKPLSILPIVVCPSRQLSIEQQNLLYIHFRKHLTHLIYNSNLHYGWIECSYFVSLTNEIRLISLKPTYSVHLTNAFDSISQYGNPIKALVNLANRQRPETPILNGKTVYIHRLWIKTKEKFVLNDLIEFREVKRISRSNECVNRHVRLRFHEKDLLNQDQQTICREIGFIQVLGDYHEIGLANLIEFRSCLLKRPELFPFIHHSLLLTDDDHFDPVTCLPSVQLLNQLEKDLNE